MAKNEKSKTTNEKPVKIDGSFLDVFKVVKKDKERRTSLEKKVDERNELKKP